MEVVYPVAELELKPDWQADKHPELLVIFVIEDSATQLLP